MIVELTALLVKGKHPILDLLDDALYLIDVREPILKASRYMSFSMLDGISLPESHCSEES